MRVADQVQFGGGGLDRQAHLRRDADLLFKQESARVVPIWRGRPLVLGNGAETRLALLDAGQGDLAAFAGSTVFLGDAGNGPLFAQDVSSWNPDHEGPLDAGPGRTAADVAAGHLAGVPKAAVFSDIRALITRLGPLDAEIAVTAKGILEWHRTHGFCATCGAPSEATAGGWHRVCLACERHHFPRTDPVVIMLVTKGNSLLVGRSPGWPEGFYSLLAGFMEPGETVSNAVRREVAEETGVQVGAVRLLASQPWPFPASLMIGCVGAATTTDITLDPEELEDAMWLTREEVLDVFAGTHPTISTPRSGAIAHFLMKMWLADCID